jgi:hypothetical protein
MSPCLNLRRISRNAARAKRAVSSGSPRQPLAGEGCFDNLANYACYEFLSGIVGCNGPVAYGQPIDTTRKVANVNFTVTRKDAADNTKSVTVKYSVK